MLLLCIDSYLKSFLRYKFLILCIYHPDAVYLREEGCEGPWLFFEVKRGSASKIVWGTLVYCTDMLVLCVFYIVLPVWWVFSQFCVLFLTLCKYCVERNTGVLY
jgi:hypothetical protein